MNKYNIIITIKNKEIKIILLDKKKEVDFIDIPDERSLGEKLLPEIDKILKRNKLSSEDVEKARIESDQEDSFTTTRIAKSVANAWNWGKNAGS